MQTARVRSENESVWVIDPAYSTLEFSVKKLFFFIVSGCLTDFTGTIMLDQTDIGRSSVEVAIKAASIATGIKRRDAHLRSVAFLDVDRYPDISFQSTKIEPGRDRDTLQLTGALTIKGERRVITIDVNDLDHSRSPDGAEVSYYSASTELDRMDFGIAYGRALIGRSLKITMNVQMIRQQG
jgi:polyisoprenoid-binding protein YceI